VSREVLDDADVGDPHREGALPGRGDLVHLAQEALLDLAPHREQRRIAPLHVAHRADEACRGECFGHPLPGLGRVGDGLLDHRVHACVRQGERDALVIHRGHGDRGRVDPGGDQRFDVGKHLQRARNAEAVATRVGDGDEVHTLGFTDHTRVVPTHRAEPDDTDPEAGHHAPAFTTELTAFTMRSRSDCDSDGCTGSEMTWVAAFSVSGRSSPGAYGASEGSRWFGIG